MGWPLKNCFGTLHNQRGLRLLGGNKFSSCLGGSVTFYSLNYPECQLRFLVCIFFCKFICGKKQHLRISHCEQEWADRLAKASKQFLYVQMLIIKPATA